MHAEGGIAACACKACSQDVSGANGLAVDSIKGYGPSHHVMNALNRMHSTSKRSHAMHLHTCQRTPLQQLAHSLPPTILVPTEPRTEGADGRSCTHCIAAAERGARRAGGARGWSCEDVPAAQLILVPAVWDAQVGCSCWPHSLD